MKFDSHWLWRDIDVLRNRQRKAAAVVAAVARVAETELTGDKQSRCFVSDYKQYESFSKGTRELLAAEPYTYYWGRLAYELLQLTLRPDRQPFGLAAYYCQSTGREPRAALARHLAEFSRMLVAAACLDGTDLRLDTPLAVAAPFALPGTALSIDGPGDVEISGVSRGAIEFSDGPLTRRSAQVTSFPTVDCLDCLIRLQPAVFNVLASGIPDDVPRLDLQMQMDNRDRIHGAVMLLNDINPKIVAQFRTGLRVVAARPRGGPGALSNVSHCDLPGAIAIYAYPNPHELCNILLHEFLHNRLFALEEQGRFLESGPAVDASGAGLYSPWRRDYRPAHGLLHAVYVFTGISRYWLDVVLNVDTPEQVRELARSRIMHGLLQVRIGLAQLHRNATFTEPGQNVVNLIEDEYQTLWNDAEQLGIGVDTPIRVFCEDGAMSVASTSQTPRSVVRHHLHRYAKADHARALESLIN